MLNTLASPFRKARSVNSTINATLPTLATKFGVVPVDASDATSSVILGIGDAYGNGMVPNEIMILPYGLGTAGTDAFTMRLIGWRRIMPATITGILFVPVPILELTACTLGTLTGQAGGQLLATEIFIKSFTIGYEPTRTAATSNMGFNRLTQPTSESMPAHVIAQLEGFEMIEFQFAQTTNTPTMNALWAPVGRRI